MLGNSFSLFHSNNMVEPQATKEAASSLPSFTNTCKLPSVPLDRAHGLGQFKDLAKD